MREKRNGKNKREEVNPRDVKKVANHIMLCEGAKAVKQLDDAGLLRKTVGGIIVFAKQLF